MSNAQAWESVTVPEDAIEVGRILDAWGVKGWFKVLPYSASPEALFSSTRWYLLPPERGARAFDGPVLLRVREAKAHAGTLVARADGLTDRDTALALRGARVLIPRSSFPSTAADEYYWVDLIGLEVVNRAGLSLGRIRELLSTGPQSVLVITYLRDGKEVERLIPFVDAFVDGVDLPNRVVRVDWLLEYD